MFSAGMSIQNLQDCLLSLPEVKLLGMKLLQDNDHAGFFPTDVPRETLKIAVIEMINYGERCQHLARQLSKLSAIPLIEMDLWEYAL